MNGKEKFLKAFKVDPCSRWCMYYNDYHWDDIKHKYLGKRWPSVEEAPDPTLIIWKNLGKGRIERCCRNLMIFIVAIILVILGFLSITKLYEVNDEYKAQKFSTAACGETEYDKKEAWEDYNLQPTELQQGFMDCFCYQEAKSRYYAVKDIAFEDAYGNSSYPCADWLKQNIVNRAVLIGLSLSISLLNGALRICLNKLSHFEGKHSETDRLASATTKMWLVQFINVGVLILLLNSRFPEDSLLAAKIKLPEDVPFLQG